MTHYMDWTMLAANMHLCVQWELQQSAFYAFAQTAECTLTVSVHVQHICTALHRSSCRLVCNFHHAKVSKISWVQLRVQVIDISAMETVS